MYDSLSLPAAGVRAVLGICARDKATARLQCRSGRVARGQRAPRASRLGRVAALTRSRAGALLAEVL
jgi:hypothetical protein